MSIELKPVTNKNFTEWRKAVRHGFGQHVHPDDITRLKNDRAELDRLVAAVDIVSDRIVATGGVDSYSLTLPGGGVIPMAGVAYMTTSVTHRRQGAFSEILSHIHNDARERGDLVSGLWASQSHLYGRFDYGLAINSYDWEIDPVHGAFSRSSVFQGTDLDSCVYFVDATEAAHILPHIYDQMRVQTTGAVDRTPGRWRYQLFDEERVRDGASALFFAVCEERGKKTGYVSYRMTRKADTDMGTLEVVEQVATTDTAHVSLWRFLLNFDLVGKLAATNRPVDDPLWWLLADPRRLVRKSHDALWLRLIDIPKALEARRYNCDGKLKIGLVSDAQIDIVGTYVLEVSEGRAAVKKTTEKPDVVMTPADLSVIYLGANSPSVLVGAGRIDPVTSGSCLKLHNMFATHSKPWCLHYF